MNRLFLLLLLLFVSCMMQAQIDIKPGVKAGVNISNITNFNTDGRTDFHVGAFGIFKFAKFYNLQPELIYSRQGAQGRFIGSDDFKLNYLSIVIANKFFPIKDVGFHFIVGPSIDIKVSDNAKELGATIEPEGFDVALLGGLGYDFPFGLGLDLRYKQGIVDVWGRNVNNTVTFEQLNANKVIMIGASYQFNF